MIAGAVRPESPAEALPERHGGETTHGPRYRAPTARLGPLIDTHRPPHRTCSDDPQGNDSPDTVARTALESILPSAVQMAPCAPQP